MIKKYSVVLAVALTTLVLSPAARGDKNQAAWLASQRAREQAAQAACPVLTPQQTTEANNKLLPDLIRLANERVDNLEKFISTFGAQGVIKEFAENWVQMLDHINLHESPQLKEELNQVTERFRNLKQRMVRIERTEHEFRNPGDRSFPNRRQILSAMEAMLPGGIENLTSRILLLEKFIQENPEYKAVAIKNAEHWATFVDLRIQKLNRLDNIKFKSAIEDLRRIHVRLKRLVVCRV